MHCAKGIIYNKITDPLPLTVASLLRWTFILLEHPFVFVQCRHFGLQAGLERSLQLYTMLSFENPD